MNVKREAGFTLIEVLVVVGMVTMSAIFFTQLFIERSEEKIATREASILMTVNASAVSYVHETGEWADQSGGCTALIEDLLTYQYLGNFGESIDSSNLTASCSESDGFYPLLTLERDNLRNENVANMVASMLPSATASGDSVTMFVPRPRGNNADVGTLIEGDVNSDGILRVNFPRGCANPKIVAYPMLVCPRDEGAALGGFRVVTKPESDHWDVQLRARADGAGSTYRNVPTCDVRDDITNSTVPVKFSVFTFCEFSED